MKLDDVKLAEVLVANGMAKPDATDFSTKLYASTSKVMFRAILWGQMKFGPHASADTTEIEHTMALGDLNEFQAIAKLYRK